MSLVLILLPTIDLTISICGIAIFFSTIFSTVYVLCLTLPDK